MFKFIVPDFKKIIKIGGKNDDFMTDLKKKLGQIITQRCPNIKPKRSLGK